MQIHGPQLAVPHGLLSYKTHHVVELCNPLTHQFLYWMVRCIALLVKNHLPNDFSIHVPVIRLSNGLSSYRIADIAIPSVLNSVKNYLFVLALFLLVLEVLTNLLVDRVRVHNHYQVVGTNFTWHVLAFRI